MALQSLEANGAALNTGEYTELVGNLDVDAFVRASRQTVEECEALRSRFSERDGQPIQWIAPIGEWSPAIVDLSHETDSSEAAWDWMAAELARAFDITGAMFSWTLIKLAETRHFWCLIAHQLAVDGAARNLVASRMADNYSRLVDAVEARTKCPVHSAIYCVRMPNIASPKNSRRAAPTGSTGWGICPPRPD